MSTETSENLCLQESTNLSTSSLQLEKEPSERLRRQLRALESENIELRRAQLRLMDAQGKDCTEEMVKLDKELRMAKDQCERWRNDYAELAKKYEMFEQSTLKQLDQRDKQISEIKGQAMDLEEENEQLLERLKDERSRIYHLQTGQHNQTIEEDVVDNARELINADLSSKIQSLDESIADLNISDADQIATHMMMILEKLDKNHREADELQNSIFAFLADHGFSANPDKFAAFANVYREVVHKRLAEIRAGNEQLRSKMSVGDKDYEACMKHLIQDSISMSTTFPSFAGFSKEPAFHPDTSVLDADLTADSVAAVNLANRTSTLAETCVRMFEKLRGTAEFFQQLLKTLGVTGDEMGDEMMRKIELMKLDLNKSIGEARSVVAEAKEAERSMRCVLEQSQAFANFNSTAYTFIGEESKVEKAQEMQLTANENEDMVQTLRARLDSELAEKEETGRKIAELQQNLEQFKREKDEMMAKIQELEGKVCEKCTELEDLYQKAKSELDKEYEAKESLKKQLDEYVETNLKLKEEFEQCSSASKENVITEDTRKMLIDQTRQELNNIFDTMSFASSRIKTVVRSTSGKKVKSTGKQQKQDQQQPPAQ